MCQPALIHMPALECVWVPGSCLLQAGQVRHLLQRVDERGQSFHFAVNADEIASQTVQGRRDVKGKKIVGQPPFAHI
jgi:hypothetical protein